MLGKKEEGKKRVEQAVALRPHDFTVLDNATCAFTMAGEISMRFGSCRGSIPLVGGSVVLSQQIDEHDIRMFFRSVEHNLLFHRA